MNNFKSPGFEPRRSVVWVKQEHWSFGSNLYRGKVIFIKHERIFFNRFLRLIFSVETFIKWSALIYKVITINGRLICSNRHELICFHHVQFEHTHVMPFTLLSIYLSIFLYYYSYIVLYLGMYHVPWVRPPATEKIKGLNL